MAEIKGCNSCIYQSTKNPPIDGVYFYPHTKASSSQQGKNGKGQNVFGLLLVQSIYARKRRDLEQIATEGFLGSS